MTEAELNSRVNILLMHMRQADLWFMVEPSKRPEDLAAEWMRLHKEMITSILKALE